MLEEVQVLNCSMLPEQSHVGRGSVSAGEGKGQDLTSHMTDAVVPWTPQGSHSL